MDGAHLEEIEQAGAASLRTAGSLQELEAAEAATFGRRSALSAAHQQLGSLPPEERREAGSVLNAVRERLRELAEARRAELAAGDRAQRLAAERLDLTEVLPAPGLGHLHVTTRTTELLEDLFLGMGYEVLEAAEVEGPPAALATGGSWEAARREHFDRATALLCSPAAQLLVGVLRSRPLPLYALVASQRARREAADAGALGFVHELDVVAVDRDVSLADVAGTIDALVRTSFGTKMHTRLRPTYFPMTEPSVRLEVTCTICEGEGCESCSGSGWAELAGGGLLHPALLEAAGVDPEAWSGFAISLGVDRLAQLRHAVPDLRLLAEGDVRFLARI